MRKKTKNSNNSFSIFAPIIAIMIIFLSIGYSSFQNTGLVSDITATIRQQMNIRITGLEIESTSDGIVVSKDYNSTSTANTYTGRVMERYNVYKNNLISNI